MMVMLAGANLTRAGVCDPRHGLGSPTISHYQSRDTPSPRSPLLPPEGAKGGGSYYVGGQQGWWADSGRVAGQG